MEGLSPLSETTTRASSWWTQRGSTDLVTGNSSTSPSGFTIRKVAELEKKLVFKFQKKGEHVFGDSRHFSGKILLCPATPLLLLQGEALISPIASSMARSSDARLAYWFIQRSLRWKLLEGVAVVVSEGSSRRFVSGICSLSRVAGDGNSGAVVHRLWEKNDVRGVMNAMEKMFDHAVYADLIGVLIEKSDIVTLDICTCLLPLLTNLLESKMDRYIVISLEMLLKLVRNFGPVIHSTLSASTSVGVDLQSEQRLERCNLCYIELEKVKHYLPSLTRRGSVSKFALELSLALQEVYYE